MKTYGSVEELIAANPGKWLAVSNLIVQGGEGTHWQPNGESYFSQWINGRIVPRNWIPEEDMTNWTQVDSLYAQLGAAISAAKGEPQQPPTTPPQPPTTPPQPPAQPPAGTVIMDVVLGVYHRYPVDDFPLNGVLAVRFNTGAASVKQHRLSGTDHATAVTRQWKVSQSPGDLALPAPSSMHSESKSITFAFFVGAAESIPLMGAPTLKANTTYYLNIRASVVPDGMSGAMFLDVV